MKYVVKIVLVVVFVISLGCEKIAMAAEPTGLDIENLPEWKVKQSSSGGKLILSDSPEMVTKDGILYQDKVEGKVRLFFYHVNATADAKKMDVVLENKGKDIVHLTVNQSSLGGPGYNWLAVGKETLTSYLNGKDKYQITIPPGGALPLSGKISETAVLPNMLINGIYDFVTDHPVTVKVMMLPILEDSVPFAQTAPMLPSDESHLRGTFDGADRQIAPVTAYDPTHDGAVALTLADNTVDSYLKGIDVTDGTKVVNYGNYGVVYQILLPSKNGGRVAYYLVPMGGYYAGAIGINNKTVKSDALATPEGKIYFGTDMQKDFAFLGAYNSGEFLSFKFSPPGASNLPVKIIILPQ